MGIIYKIQNIINDKIYIGQTQISLEKRWNEHLRDTKRRDYKFHRAIRKYGEESFSKEIIEEVSDDMLNEREIYWISYYDSYHNGYNSTLGGDGSLKINRELIIELWDKGYSIEEIHKEVGYCKLTITKTLQSYKNYSHQESVHRGKRNQTKKICQYDMNGQYIKTFDSLTIAATEMGVDRNAISSCCRNKRPSCKGFLWRYNNDAPPQNYLSEQKNKRPVLQFDKTGLFIRKFDSITDASKEIGTSHTSIHRCCSGKSKTSGGFVWKFADEVVMQNV